MRAQSPNESVPIRVSCSPKLSISFVLDEVFVVSFGRTVSSLALLRPGLQEVSVRNRIVQSVFLVAAVFAVSVVPAFAADGTGEFGLSSANKNVGLGVNGEYTSKLRDMGTDRSSSWLVDIAYLHKGFDTFGSDFSVSSFQIQGGWRFTGKAGDKG